MSEVKNYSFNKIGIETLGADAQEMNWPVVYQIYDSLNIYIGETTNLKSRMQQHINNNEKTSLSKFSVVFDSKFNKSVALDLESYLIQMFSGDGKYTMLNKNDGLVDHNYYHRDSYRNNFSLIWDQLIKLDVASKTIQEIENSGLFKFSPYKQLNQEQLRVVSDVLTDIEEAFKSKQKTISIIGGDEGTGKSIVLIYLIKLICDIQDHYIDFKEENRNDSIFERYFKNPTNTYFKNIKLALVVPNPSLKGSVEKVFKGVSNLKSNVEVLSPIEYGSCDTRYDITFVDEAHLLKISNQEVHKANRERVDLINNKLFGEGEIRTELDWIIKKSTNIVLVYGDQRIRQNNITIQDLPNNYREHILKNQIRSNGGEPYINYLKSILSNSPPSQLESFNDFEFKLYENFCQFIEAIKYKEKSVGLSRLVAGFAWEWKSKKDKTAFDIIIDGIGLKWNSTLIDFVGSKKSAEEVGSIYTIQGSDLNYCGVIIGNDLQYDPINHRLLLNKNNYYDRGAKKRNKRQIEADVQLTDEELLDQVLRTYRILMNRSIKGTYVYVCDFELRKYLTNYIEVA